MKKIIVAAGLLVASLSFAQKGTDNSVDAVLGFTRGAVNLGATYERNANESMGWGGYFFLQTEKEKSNTVIVNQLMAFGAMVKAHVLQRNNLDVYVAPGFGLAMITDVSDGAGGEDDKTVFGPSMKIGAQYYLTPKMKLGLERFMIVNWFDDEAPATGEYTSAVMGFEF